MKGKQKKALNPQQLLERQKKLTGEIFILKNEIVTERSNRNVSRTTASHCRQKVKEAKDELVRKEEDHKSVNSNLIRQFKSLQTSCDEKVTILQQELASANAQIRTKNERIEEMEREHQKMAETLNLEIESLKIKINGMEKEFETIFNNTVDNLIRQVLATREKSRRKASKLISGDRELLGEMGLMPKYK